MKSNTALQVQIGTVISWGVLNTGRGVVYAIHGEQKPDSVKHLGGGVVSMGGNADFDIVFETGGRADRVPECILRGVQWEIFEEVVPQEEIDRLLANADEHAAKNKAKAEAESKAFAEAIDGLRTDKAIKYLTPISDPYDMNGAAKNVRATLKQYFPKVKFSVRRDSFTLRVSWTDGPTAKQVNEILAPFKTGGFDLDQDMPTSKDTPFTVVYGGFEYLFTSRETSLELVEKAIAHVYERFAGNLRDTKRYTAEEYRKGGLRMVEIPHLHKSLGEYIEETILDTAA